MHKVTTAVCFKLTLGSSKFALLLKVTLLQLYGHD